ncbi:PREDICTED: protein DCL, chloroplastic isoform X2 [Tarenaya hassleriana]|uniref:protein DCL, chloroplastic isoform X2 n=1 Tax=Tarenaya hassleriana TaxID=28532 RepID=UPI00053C2B44|nr:PREDICTED: protein DCL, chloroplastic isoform X2 [Tarenaya hassleriana]
MISVSRSPSVAAAVQSCFCAGSSLTALSSSPVTLHFPRGTAAGVRFRVFAVKTESDGSELLRRPHILSEEDQSSGSEEDESGEHGEAEEEIVDWEDKILEVTVPLVGLVRMILHSDKYGNGDRLSPGHERTVVERLLPYHPEYEDKIGPGIDYIMVGRHPDFESSRCLFVARKDGEIIDFSYWKCIKGLIRKNYPLYAGSFILRHFPKNVG